MQSSSEKYQAPWGVVEWGNAVVKDFQVRNMHTEDARISPASLPCVVFHHVADSVLKAQYSRLRKRENNLCCHRANTKHSVSANFLLYGTWRGNTRSHGCCNSESHTWHIEREV